jgi:hypothetical protein
MTSLREEIENIILNDRISFVNDNDRWIKESTLVDKIMSRIEIRIDGMEDSYERHKPDSLKLEPFEVLNDIRTYMGLARKEKI